MSETHAVNYEQVIPNILKSMAGVHQVIDEEISILTATIAMINLWNRINVSRH